MAFKELKTVTERGKPKIVNDNVEWELITRPVEEGEKPDQVWIPDDPGKQPSKKDCFDNHYARGQLRGGLMDADGERLNKINGYLPEGKEYIACEECEHKFTLTDIKKYL